MNGCITGPMSGSGCKTRSLSFIDAAAAAFTTPAPADSVSPSRTGVALPIRSALTSSGVSCGLADNSSAAAPAVTAADMLVPEPLK